VKRAQPFSGARQAPEAVWWGRVFLLLGLVLVVLALVGCVSFGSNTPVTSNAAPGDLVTDVITLTHSLASVTDEDPDVFGQLGVSLPKGAVMAGEVITLHSITETWLLTRSASLSFEAEIYDHRPGFDWWVAATPRMAYPLTKTALYTAEISYYLGPNTGHFGVHYLAGTSHSEFASQYPALYTRTFTVTTPLAAPAFRPVWGEDWLCLGDTGSFTVQLSNLSTTDDTYTISAEVNEPDGPPGPDSRYEGVPDADGIIIFDLSEIPAQIALAPGISRTLTIRVAVPESTLPGRHTLTLRATSANDPDYSSEHTLTINILPDEFVLAAANLRLGWVMHPVSREPFWFSLPVRPGNWVMAVSPDNRWMAISNPQLHLPPYVMDLDQPSDHYPLTSDTLGYQMAVFSSDSARLHVTSFGYDDLHSYLVPNDSPVIYSLGAPIQSIAAPANPNHVLAAWSLNGIYGVAEIDVAAISHRTVLTASAPISELVSSVPSNRLYYYSNGSRTIEVVRASDYAKLSRYTLPANITDIAVNEDGSQLYATTATAFYVLDPATGAIRWERAYTAPLILTSLKGIYRNYVYVSHGERVDPRDVRLRDLLDVTNHSLVRQGMCMSGAMVTVMDTGYTVAEHRLWMPLGYNQKVQ